MEKNSITKLENSIFINFVKGMHKDARVFTPVRTSGWLVKVAVNAPVLQTKDKREHFEYLFYDNLESGLNYVCIFEDDNGVKLDRSKLFSKYLELVEMQQQENIKQVNECLSNAEDEFTVL